MKISKHGFFANIGPGIAVVVAVACGPSVPAPPAPVAPAPAGATNPTSAVAAQQTAAVATPGVAATAVANAHSIAFDQQFIDKMVPHHQGALEMARIARQRAQHPEIRQLADDILQSQDAEISRMRQWRQAWYGSSAMPPMNQMPMVVGIAGMSHAAPTMDMAADVDSLRVAQAPFDIAFIDAMIPHHQSAIEAARVALQQSTRSEIQELAVGILEAQQREIGQMRAWRLAWGQATAPAAVVTPATGEMPGMTMPGHEVPGEDMGH